MAVDMIHGCRKVVVVQQHDAIAVLVDVVHTGMRIEAHVTVHMRVQLAEPDG